MSKVIIIADDLTGANATGVLLARQGFKTATFLDLDKYDEEENGNLDVISISTDSRAIERKEAYDRVSKIVKFFNSKDIKLFTKRIDSTLRGNIGAEIEGVLDNVDEDAMAIVVSSFPASERVTIGGYLMVNSIPLEKTDVARDPKTPVYTSYVYKLIKSQTKYSVGSILLDKVLKGPEEIRKAILKEKEEGTKIVILDATTDEDISNIAKGVKKSGVKAVAVDPGPFTSALAKEFLGEPKEEPGLKVMLTIGSVTNLTRRQLEKLRLKYSPLIVNVDAKKLVYDNSREQEIKEVVQELVANMDNYSIIGVTTSGFDQSKVLNLKEISKELNIDEEEISKRICNGLASITKEILSRKKDVIGGLYTSGGDVTVAVCDNLESAGIEVKDEVLPLAVYGRIINGQYNNKAIITKGGLVGNDDALITCVKYLLTKLSNDYHIKDK